MEIFGEGYFMNSEDTLNLIYPLQWVAKILQLYISGAQNQNPKGIKSELIYFVIPLIANDIIRDKLKCARSTSSFSSIFETKMTDKKEYSINISERVESFSKVTNDGLIQLGNETEVDFSEYITVSKTLKYTEFKSSFDFDFYKAAYYLGLIFSKEDYRTIFLRLGVIPL
jgi:hypothetical protein